MSKLKKKLKTQGKNSKLKVKTRKVGTFRISGCRKSVQKSLLASSLVYLNVMVLLCFTVELIPDPEQYPEDWGDWKTDFEYQNEVAADLVMNKSSKVVSSTTGWAAIVVFFLFSVCLKKKLFI